MKQKVLALTAAAVLALSLAGCMPQQQPPAPQGGAEDAQNSAQENQPAAANPFGGRKDPAAQEPEKTELRVNVNGTDQTVPATVYAGAVYTIAVPEGWERDENEPQWNPAANDDVELTIRFYGGKKTEAVLKLFQRDREDYVFEEARESQLGGAGKVTELRGSEMEDGQITDLIAYFLETEQGCFGILLECPGADAETYGAYLGAMANSFQLKPQK